jgi:hypothetical protein
MHWPLRRIAVVEQSMEPALAPGDWLLAWCGLPGLGPPRIAKGQIVLAYHPKRPGLLLVKRAAFRDRDGWWLESDNPDAAGARDSWTFGAVPARLIVGRMLLRYGHGDVQDGRADPRGRRGRPRGGRGPESS